MSPKTEKAPKTATPKASPMTGKILVKTEKGIGARRGNTRRTASWNALRSGASYDAAVKAGVVPADLAKMIVLGHVVVRAAGEKAPKAPKAPRAPKAPKAPKAPSAEVAAA